MMIMCLGEGGAEQEQGGCPGKRNVHQTGARYRA